MRKHLLVYLRAGLFALLVILTLSALYITIQNTRSAETIAVQSLESTALSLSVSAEHALRPGARAGDEIAEIFSDRVVAYAMIASKDGLVLFHSNPRLEGWRFSEDEVSRWPGPGTSSSRRIILGTGTPAYEFNFTLLSPEGEPRLLRIVLNTAPADKIIAGADRIWWIVFGVLALLWAVGIALERIVTRYVKLQDKLERQERLTLIGQMTSVLAHEIRNALGGIKGFSQWVGERMDDGDERKTAVSAVVVGADRIEALVNDLLQFSRDEVYQTRDIEIRQVAEEALGLAAFSWSGRVELDIDKGIYVRGDMDKLHQVLVNGVKNAVEAMGDNGLLKISAALNSGKVAIRIEDSGKGVPDTDVPRLFTPFFTSKANGTGLGLAYSRKVIEGMGGTIELSNKPGCEGAVLIIRLPGGNR